MKVLLTGGAGDLASVLVKPLVAQGDQPLLLDIRPPQVNQAEFIQGSITERGLLAQVLPQVEAIIHIAAWHGYHEVTGQKNVYDFWDVNVNGTFLLLEAAAQAGVQQVVFISSTSAEERASTYGHTKVLGEEMVWAYAQRHNMNAIILRPRAFIPHWNKAVYRDFIEWAKWFWPGAVHIDDVAAGVLQSLALLRRTQLPDPLTLVLDGAYEYSEADLAEWRGLETFLRYYAPYYELALQHGLDPALKPTRYDMRETERWLGYRPRYSLQSLLQDLRDYGAAGPPRP
jgi:nucleoside-diphosphate-sugar epimerase